MIKALIFDNGDVLVTDTWLEYLNLLDQKYGESAAASYKEAFRPIAKAATTGEINFAEFKTRVSDIVGESESLDSTLRAGEVNEDMYSLLEDLKQQFDLSMLTNDISTFRSDNEVWKWERIFGNKLFCSSEIGFSKPDPRIFEYVLDKIGYQPEECIFIDDKSRNVEAATKLGINGIIFTDKEHFISDLNEIVESHNDEKR